MGGANALIFFGLLNAAFSKETAENTARLILPNAKLSS